MPGPVPSPAALREALARRLPFLRAGAPPGDNRVGGVLTPAGFLRAWTGRGPFYEVWFGKVDLGPGRALWLRYTLLDGTKREASVWGLLFEDGGARIVAGKATRPLGELAPARGATVFELGGSRLEPAHAVGEAGPLSWDLTLEDSGRRFDHVPPGLKRLGFKSRYCSALLDLRVRGQVREGGRTLELQGARGMMGHIHGVHQVDGWAWTHASTFDDGSDTVFEALSARARVAGRASPPISSFVLVAEGRRWEFGGLAWMATARSDFAIGRWSFATRQPGPCLEGTLRVDPSRVAVVTYDDTDGSNLWCHNSKLAELELRLTEGGRVRTWKATGSAAFEVVTRERPAGPVTL